MNPKHNRILLTGAAGGLGTVLQPELTRWAEHVRLSDRGTIKNAHADHEIDICDIAEPEATLRITEGVDVIVHMAGAVGPALPFEEVLRSNYQGLRNLYEASRRNGVRRIIWGSSNHAIGFYGRTQRIDAAVTPRPDGDYGISKVFGEAVAQYHWDRFGIETVSLRIGSCFPKPIDRRMLTTWLSYPDFIHLIDCSIVAPRVEHTIVYGVSNNDSQLWDNHMAGHLGYRPKDNDEVFRAEIEATTPAYSRDDAVVAVHGGAYAGAEPIVF